MNYRFLGAIQTDGWTAVHYAERFGGSLRHKETGKTFSADAIHKMAEVVVKHPNEVFDASVFEYVAPRAT